MRLSSLLSVGILGLGISVFGQTSSTFRVDRVVAGVRLAGTAPNVSVEEDIKTAFAIHQDPQALVYFEFSGPAGSHHFEGVWKSPSGFEVGRSEFTADSPIGRFSASWPLILGENTALGRWTVECLIDGNLVGTYPIEVIGAGSTPVASTSAARLPSVAEIYKRGVGATVFVQHVDSSGRAVSVGSGFFIAQDIVATAFESIDGAGALILTSGSKTFHVSRGFSLWDRFADWALLRTAEPLGGLP